eukprot:758942-Hanusia_phi.AAC.1
MEYRSIQGILRSIDVRNLSTTVPPCKWGDVLQEVRSRCPLILHFACHAEESAIRLFRREVDADTIRKALQSHNEQARKSGRGQVQLVVFNACCSNGHAEKLKGVVDFVIGHRGNLDDLDAVEFAHSFYDKFLQGQSLWSSMKTAKGCSSGYELHTNCDAKAFCLPMPEESSTDTVTEEEDTVMIRLFKENGFGKKARSLCEDMGIEDWKIEDLELLTDESLDELTETKLKSHEKKMFWKVVSKKLKEMSVRTAQLCSPAGDDTDLSENETIYETDKSDDHDSEDNSSQTEVVVARNAGDKENFEKHLTRFLRAFGKFSFNHQMSINVNKEMLQTEWTMCMLLWQRVAKDAKMHEESREKWNKCLSSPSPDNMMRTLDEILCRGDVTYTHWKNAKDAANKCKKRLASVVFLTHELVRALLPSDHSCRQEWDKWVMRDWSVNTEDGSQVIKRMNTFMWSQVEAIRVITNVIETQSYVCYMHMHKVASLILFEYLETYRKINASDDCKRVSCTSSPLEGFSLFASSSGRIFSLQKISLRDRRMIKRNLKTLASLPSCLLLFLGPSRRAEGLLEDDGRSILTEHQRAKASECEEAMMRRRGVHLRGPAGTGKTFMALHMMLRELEKDRSCCVLFVLRSEGFVHFIAQWMLSMARWKLVDAGLFDRILFSLRGERGWDGPFRVTEGEGELRRQEGTIKLLLGDESEYKYVVVDEAHHAFSDREATEYIKTKCHEKAKMMLMSDSSQADVPSIAYPGDLQDVYLTEVVRNSQRTMTASFLFQRGISTAQVSCYHKVAGRPVRPYVFPSISGNERSCQASDYVPHVVGAVKEAMVEYPENLNRQIAILVHEKLVREGLRQALQERLDQDTHFQSRFKLIDTTEAWKTTRAGDDWSERENIIFDTVGNFDGMESKIVIAVGLDEESSADVDLQRSLLYRAITRALNEGIVMLVNHRVEGGLLSFLDGVKFEDKFDAEKEKKKIDKTPWEHVDPKGKVEILHSFREAGTKMEADSKKAKGKGKREMNDTTKLSSTSTQLPSPSEITSSTPLKVSTASDVVSPNNGQESGKLALVLPSHSYVSHLETSH